MDVFLGISASGGIGIGTAFVIPEAVQRTIPQTRITAEQHEAQWKRFQTALQNVSVQISNDLLAVKDDPVQYGIFETYVLMLNDPEFLGDVEKSFKEGDRPIAFVLNQKTEEYADRLRKSGNEYLAERAQDICDVFGRVLDDLLDYHPFDINTVPDGAVIVARSMSPSDTMILSRRKIAGIALIEGGVSSHVGILARNFGIPAVFDLHRITEHAQNGYTIVVDGEMGEVTLNPDDFTRLDYERKIEAFQKHAQALAVWRTKNGETKDGVRFGLFANIGTVEEAKIAQEEGADGIGLFRTEFLFMNSGNTRHGENSFSEESQFKAYKEVLEIMKGKPVTIRTLDAGGDKLIASLDMGNRDEKNPLLGLRAIRLSLHYPKQLRTQLRALYRASVYGDLKIMIPLVTDVAQVKKVRELTLEVQEDLKAHDIPFNKDVPLGIMVETAAAAITADRLATVSDFFSIGTNDLTQYTIGVDRENSDVSELYNELHPAVLRMIANTIDNAGHEGISVSVCGEMASRKDSVMVLGGLGIRNLSMSAKQISNVKELLSQYTISDLEIAARIAFNTV